MSSIRKAIQQLIDSLDGEGWSVTQHCVVMGLERVIDGRIESIAWHWAPPDQPDWMTDALLEQAIRVRDEAAHADDDD